MVVGVQVCQQDRLVGHLERHQVLGADRGDDGSLPSCHKAEDAKKGQGLVVDSTQEGVDIRSSSCWSAVLSNGVAFVEEDDHGQRFDALAVAHAVWIIAVDADEAAFAFGGSG